MSSYSSSNKNQLQAVLRQSKAQSLRESLKTMLLPRFEIGDQFVTLTFGPEYKFDEVKFGHKLKLFYQKINREIYGKGFDRGYKSLRSVSIAEYNNSDGLHIHMLLEDPKVEYEGDFTELIKSTWLRMNWGTVKKAQDVEAVYETVDRVIDYMTKQIRHPDHLNRVDIRNIQF